MAYFTAYFQKKALKFALSQLGVFDEQAFDLESPGISWGATTTIELQDVPLSVSRLTELFRLPSHVNLIESRISLLRLTIPLNFVSNSVAIEIEGVRIRLAVSSSNLKGYDGSRYGVKAERGSGAKARHPKTSVEAVSPASGIPTADDLAGSFLATQSVYERAEMRSAIAGVKKSQERVDSEDAEHVGLGPDVSLKTFFSNLARGVLDRFKASIKDVQIEATFKLPITNPNDFEYGQTPDEVTFCLDVENLHIPPVSQDEQGASVGLPVEEASQRARNISIVGIHGSILSTSALSSFMTQLSRPPSPTLSRATSKISGHINSTESISRNSRLKSALKVEPADVSGLKVQLDDNAEALRRSELSLDSESESARWTSSARLTSRHGSPEQHVVGFGEDSQALSDSELTNFQVAFHSLSRLSSDLENSILSENSESFLGKSPMDQQGFGLSSARSKTPSHEDYNTPLPSSGGIPSAQTEDLLEEDLTESRFFSAEEARSIYMSAMSSENRQSKAPQKMPEPGPEPDSPDSSRDVFHDASTGSSGLSTHSQTEHASFLASGASSSRRQAGHEDLTVHESSDEDSPPASLLIASHSSTPEADSDADINVRSREHIGLPDLPATHNDTQDQSPNHEHGSLPRVSSTTVKTIFVLDNIQVKLPPSAPDSLPMQDDSGNQSTSDALPGAFSYHGSMEASTAAGIEGIGDAPQNLPPQERQESDARVAIKVSNFVISIDMALVRLLITIVNFLPRAVSNDTAEEGSRKPNRTGITYNLNIGRTIVRFEQALKTHPRHSTNAMLDLVDNAFSPSSDDLLRCFVQDFSISSQQSRHEHHLEMAVSKFSIGFPDEHIMSFNRDLKMRESVRDFMTPSALDIAIKMVRNQANVNQIEINTAPLHLRLNISRLAEVLSWLGGLSTVIDLGNSVKSNITITGSQPPSGEGKARGVHFDIAEPVVDTRALVKPAPKCNLRFGGLAVDIIGREAEVLVEGSALKVVFRDGAIRAQIDHVNLYGPLLQHDRGNPALVLSIDSLAVSYFDLPKESDLTRLLALLSPYQERDEQDDDILLDTLLRQRRKGGVLRVNVTKAKARFSELQKFLHFTTMAEELSQLSSVAKYLPEDDRPGLLILLGIDNAQVNTDISQNMNSLSLSIHNIQFALVTFPSLFLMAIGNISASQAGVELVSKATPDLRRPTTRQPLLLEEPPQMCMKFIAGEMEPTVRLRLHGLRFEYHVSTVMALLNISETASGDVIVSEMVNTVANLATIDNALGQSLLFQAEDNATKKEKPFRIDVTLRDTIIGLNPKGKSGHGIVVLTKCRLSATHADEALSQSHGSLEIAKASLMVVDDKSTLLTAEDITDPNVISGLGTKPTQIQSLEAVGYVSVGEISAAKVTGHLKVATSGSVLDVHIRNDLLVLETCADSTQTLLNIMGGLSPPMPPRKGKKYRTEIVPIENMLASFTGDAFPADTSTEDDTDYASTSDDESGTIALGDKDDLGSEADWDAQGSFQNENPIASSMVSFGVESVIFRQAKPDGIAKPELSSTFQEEAGIASSLHFNEDHFGKPAGGGAKEWNSYKNTYEAASPAKICNSPLQIHFDDVHFIWNLYDGYDWQKTRDTITLAVEEIEAKAEERRAARRDKLRNIEDEDIEAVIGDMLFNSIYIGVSAKDDPRDLRRKVNGVLNDDASDTGSYATSTTASSGHARQGSPRSKRKRLRLGRSKHHKMTFEIKGISGSVVCFPPDSGETQSSIDIKVRDLEVFDNIPTSTWRKFATYLHDAGSRQLGSNMVHMEMLVVKPNPDLLASEFVLKIGVLPLRLHVDQDALDFLTRFFGFREDEVSEAVPLSEPPFIQRAEVGPVQIKLDFKPKRVDWKALRSGKTAEFMNFIILDEADMILRRIILYGVRGFDKLGRSLNDIWTPDVRTNQLPGVLAGLAPVRPLVNVGLGVRDLVVVPMREYKKDGRLVRAVRKGVVSFGRTTTTELAKLGAKLAIGTHTMLSGAEGLLAPDVRGPVSRGSERDWSVPEEQKLLSPYADQPVGVVQGLRGAYRGLERDLLLAKDAIIAMPGEVMDSQDAGGAAAAILRTAPVVILRPAMGITKAVGQTLMGATNSLDKAERRRIEDKYKHR